MSSDPPSQAKAAPKKKGALAWTSSTYFAEGLPWSILHQVAAEFFTEVGAPASRVGSTSLLHAPTLLKVVWSPLVQVWGSLRSWMIATQALMGLAVGLLALAAHQVASADGARAGESPLIWGLLVAVGVLSATHDIACDGYYMSRLSAADQAKYSGLRVAAFRAAMMVGTSGLVILAGRSNWLYGFGAGASLLLGLALFHFFFLEKVVESPPSDSAPAEKAERTRYEIVVDSYVSFLRQDAVLLVIGFLLTYKMADVLLFSMSRVMFRNELGIGADLRGTIGFFSIASSIIGAIVGGAWISKKGLKKTLVPITFLMAGTEPLYAMLASSAESLSIFHAGHPATMATFSWASDGLTMVLATLVIVVEQLCGGLATAAQMVFIMRRCHVKHRTAHFAFATAIYSVAQMGLGFGSGFVFEQTGSTAYFWIVSALTLPAIAFAFVVPKD